MERWGHVRTGNPGGATVTDIEPVGTDNEQEGWFTDPFLIHEERWLSDGRPTKLVKDGGVESFDQPPDGAPTQTPTRIEADPNRSAGSDLQRADDAQIGRGGGSISVPDGGLGQLRFGPHRSAPLGRHGLLISSGGS